MGLALFKENIISLFDLNRAQRTMASINGIAHTHSREALLPHKSGLGTVARVTSLSLPLRMLSCVYL